MVRRPPAVPAELARLRQQFTALVEQALLDAGQATGELVRPGTWSPDVDVVETPEAFVLSVELPGVQLDEVELEADDHQLVLTGVRRPPGEGEAFLRLEGSYGPFHRVFDFVEPIDPERIAAELRRGVLEVTVGKRTPPSARVPIRDGEERP